MARDRSINYIFPEDAVVMRDATKLACARANARTPLERDRIADSVLWLARCGYARHSDGTLDAGVLADAALTVGGVDATPGRRVSPDYGFEANDRDRLAS